MIGDPVGPVKPKNIEQVLAEQANDAMAQGADPHAATDMLGTMVKHLRANPDIAQHASDAIAQGADPHAVSAQIYQMASATPKATPGQQFSALVANGASLGFAPKVLGALDAANKMLPRGLGGESAPASSFGANYTATRDRIRAAAQQGIDEHPIAGRAAEFAGGALAALPAAAGRAVVGGADMLEQTLARKLAERTATGAGVGALAGAGNATGGIEDYAKAAGVGALTGAVVGNVLPPAFEAGGKGLSRTITALGLRPTGRTAEEMAADAAAMKEPVGPQANASAPSATPVQDAVKNGPTIPVGNDAPRTPTLGQRAATARTTLGQRVRANVGAAAENVGVESSKTRALREVARRFELDNVTPADALAYADQAGNKPVAVMDLGGGNVGGLARTAKDVPSLARRQIPAFLNQRSAGTFGDEGATLQRITGDIEQRIGLAPENYYKSLDDMTGEMKATAKTNYDKIRNTEIDDPEVLSLFNEPEWRGVHERIRTNARIGGKDPIPPLTSTAKVGGEEVTTQNPQTLGTLDKMKRHLDKVIAGKVEGGPLDKDLAYNMRQRLNTILDRMDELHPAYGEARNQYRGSAEAIDAYQAGKDEFMKLDPRAIQAKLSAMPDRLQDLYRRGGYDALRASKLTKMDDGANIGAFLEKNPDIRDRVAALAKAPEDATALRGDLNVERQMGDRKNFILGGPNTAERIIDHETTKPMVTHVGDALRMIPFGGKLAGGLVDNTISRRMSEQTGDVMGEVGKIMTRTGRPGMELTFSDIARLKAEDEAQKLLRAHIASSFTGPASAGAVRKR